MADAKYCPHCGSKLSQDAPRGLCPKCLIKMGLAGSADVEITLEGPGVIEGPGTRIGHYELLELIGEGGMGMVYLAEQQEPVKRRVALKIIKPGMDSKEVIARFEAERQTLAVLDHPNIAHVFDAGMTDTGRPYFVMEHVRGLSITEYSDERKLSVQERLKLFKEVCEGVHHAHQKGIIHRDIKPSNILVSVHGDRAVPKIIDFGIAKAITQPLTDTTVFTYRGQLLGTPEYMSPEQVDLATQDIDTRSDIYSLGVLLYELLAGVLPFDRASFKKAGFAEIQKTIREEEPATPSTRLTSLGEEAKAIAERRQTQLLTLARCLHRELEWIPMKAMRKDRARRYRSASELADDVRNYLSGAPLAAGPESSVYRARKFMRKHAGSVTTAALVAVAIILGLVASIIMGCRAEKARQKEASARQQVEEALARAEKAERLAEQRRAEAQAVTDFLNKDILRSVQLALTEGSEVTGRHVFDIASENIDRRFEGEPLVEASIRQTLGLIYFGLGEYRPAESHLTRAVEIRRGLLGEDDPYTLRSMNSLGWLYAKQLRYDQAEPLFIKGLATSRRALGEEHPETLAYMGDLAVVYAAQGQREKAEQLYIETLELSRPILGQEHPDVLDCMQDLAGMYATQGRNEEAKPLLLKVLNVRRRTLGEEHLKTLRSMHTLAWTYMINEGRYEEAEPLLIKVLDTRRRKLGERHPDTLLSMRALGYLCMLEARYDEAETLYAKALKISRGLLGEEHRDTLKSMGNLVWMYKEQERYDKVEELYMRILESRCRELGKEHQDTLKSMDRLASLYQEQGRYDEAQPLLTKAHDVRRRTLGADHPETRKAVKNLIDLYEAWNKPEEAAEWRAKLPPAETIEE